MKLNLLPRAYLALASLTLPLLAAETKKDHDHGGHGHSHEKKVAGPNGGRLLIALDPHSEFLVTPDRKVQITFLDEKDRPVPPAQQVVIVTAGQRSAPARLVFERKGDVLVSTTALPPGQEFPAVVQIKITPDAKFVTEKFNVNLARCPDCKHAEYACTCADH